MGCKEKDVPWGIVEADSAALTIPFGRSCKTSAVIVDALAAKWDAWDAHEKAATSRLPINMENGPESSGRRTPCLPRIGQRADPRQKPRPRLYSPPYHSKYHPIERCWGSVELKWHGTKRIDAETRVEWAKRMTWKGLAPVVARSHKGDQKGMALGKAARQAVEKRLERHPALPKDDIVSNPAPTS